MNKEQALSIIYFVKQQIQTNLKYLSDNNFKLESNMSYTTSNTNHNEKIIHIGSDILFDNNIKNISDNEFVTILVSLYHETYGHTQLLHNHIDNKESKIILQNHFACQSSCYYYNEYNIYTSTNYFNQPHEIAAQYIGITYAYQSLEQLFGQEKANDMICEYVNDRIQKNSSFLKTNKTYKNVNTILTDLNHEFQKQSKQPKIWTYEKAKLCPDPSYHYFANRMRIDEQETRKKIKKLENCKDGELQNKILTAIYLEEEDKNNTLKNNIPELQDIPPAKAIFNLKEELFAKFRYDRTLNLDSLFIHNNKPDNENDFSP